MTKNDELKLIFILKVGYNAKKEGIYEFLFSKAPYDIETDNYDWGELPASNFIDTLIPLEYVNDMVKLKTKKFNLICLHESDDRPYEHGFFSIHAIAYEDYNGEDDDNNLDDNAVLWNDLPILVFHYAMSKTQVLEILGERDFVLDGENLIYNGEIKS